MAKKVNVLNSEQGYNLLADYYNKREKYWDTFEKDRVLPLLGDLSGKKILDVGAGTGRLAIRLAKFGGEVTALDVSEEMLKKIKNKNSKIKIVIGEAENLEFEAESFDFVIATFLIVHLKDLPRFFDEVYRVLKPGGIFLVTNINQRKAPAIDTKEGMVEIESYYHRPEMVVEELENLAFGIVKNEFVKEGEVWINQIVVAQK